MKKLRNALLAGLLTPIWASPVGATTVVMDSVPKVAPQEGRLAQTLGAASNLDIWLEEYNMCSAKCSTTMDPEDLAYFSGWLTVHGRRPSVRAATVIALL